MNRSTSRWVAVAACIGTLLAGLSGLSPSTTASAAPAPYCGPTTHYKASGQKWVCSFADEFTGFGVDPHRWSVQRTAMTGLHSGPECLVDSGKNVSVALGVLRLTTRKESKPFTCRSPHGSYRTQYTGGGVNSIGKFQQAFGRFEFRARFPTSPVPGLQSALWLYPTRNNYGAWPASGEIDVAEHYSQYADRVIPYVHYRMPKKDPSVTNWFCHIDPRRFHTYVAEWTRTGVTISIDGRTCVQHVWRARSPLRAPQPFDQPFSVLMTQVLGIGTNAFVAGRTPLPATTEVDWVRVWR